jgi:hypothetical protein
VFQFAEMQLVLCKNNASRTQWNVFQIAEMQLVLCKDIAFSHKNCTQNEFFHEKIL